MNKSNEYQWKLLPYYSNKEIKNVVKVLKSGKVNYWTGNYCKKFENYTQKSLI